MLKKLYSKALLLLTIGTATLHAQTTTVFSDDFSTSAGTSYTSSAGAIGSSTNWNLSRSGADFGARITSGSMSLTNDASSAGNTNGWSLAATNTASFTTPYNTTLSSNPGMVTWTFNMRQPQANPSGFASGNYGAAFILAGTSGTTNSSGTGYAVILGNSGKIDPLKLVSYSAGLQTTSQIVASNTTGLTDFGNTYLSVKVTYTPSTNTWQLYVRNDGTAFIDPNSGSLTSQGTAVNSTFTSTALPIMGAFWNSSTKVNQAALYDNVKVTVVVPTTTSISPPSKVAGSGAFTLTVNGTGFVSGTSVVRWNGSNRTTTFVSATQLTASIVSTDITSSGTATITVANGVAVSNGQTFAIDPAGVPNISLSTSALNTMTTLTGTASSAQTYTVSGSNLTADVTVTAPTNFEVSPNGSTYSGAITLTRTGNVLVGQPVTVYARVKASAPSGLYSATIDQTTTGGTTKSIAVSATVIAAKPTTQATAVTFTTVTSTTFTVNWTNGNGANHLVLIRSGSAVNSNPVDGVIYTAITSFGAGSEVGTGNYAIYSGNSNTVNITGLQPNTTYHVAVYDYNGSGGTESYLTTSPATGNRTTLNAPVGWQIYNTNTTNAITFDTTVDGVNEGVFQAAGLSSTLTNGELNSNAWAITGFSDGAIAFGGTSVDGLDYDRGTSTGGVTIGGVYAFDTATNNYALGIQPATGDFVPGSVTLRFQNQTGVAVTSVSIGYKVYVYNDQAASSSFNFSHSADNSTYTSVSGLNVISPTTADLVPGWKSYYRVVTLTGLNIANNNYYHFRWTGATVSGSGDFDEFGLDDIVMVANPSTNYASFNGTAENFVVLGNTTLSGSTTVTSDLTINGGKVDINGNTLSLNGTITNTTSEGLKGSASSNLTIGGAVSPSLSFDQTTLGTTNVLNNLSINTTASNTVAISNPVVVNGTLTTALGQTLNMGTNALTGTFTTIANNGTIATQNTTSLPIPSGKTWSGTGTVNYNAASAAQTIVVGTYQNLTSSSAGGATAAGNLTVNGVLDLPASNPSSTVGSLNMSNYTLTMGANATNTGIGDVTGIVTRNSIVINTSYTLGNPYTFIVFPATGTLPTSVSLKTTIGAAPTWKTGAINRVYDFIQTGGSGTKAVMKLHYLDSELNGNVETKLVDWIYNIPLTTTVELGSANYNNTNNWIELTNINVATYFSSSFGVAALTLDESEATSLTWNGSVSDSWTNPANWTPNATPSDNTVVYIPDAATTPNDPTLSAVVLLGTLNIDAGGILNAPDNSQFTINGGVGAWINYGTYNPGTGTSTVIFTSGVGTMGGTTNFNNMTINSGAILRPMSNCITRIAGELVINGKLLSGAMANIFEFTGTGQTIPNPNGPSLNAYHHLVINGTGAIFPTSLNIKGDLTLNQSVDFTGKTIVMSGGISFSQYIKGTSNPVFDNLTINNNSLGEVTLQTNATITGTLTLTSGNFILENDVLTLGANAVAGSFSASTMIVATGNAELRRTFTGTGSYLFPIGEASNTADYSPITVNLTAGTFSNAYIGVSVVDAIHLNNASASNNISRYWKVNQSGITGAVATISANYVNADLTGAETEISGGQLNGTFNQATNPWIKYAALASNSFTATGATLTAGQTSSFTGIKGGSFTSVISGYGSFCLNDTVSLTATPTGGDAPYTYSWSGGLGNQANATPPTNSVGTINYTVTVKDSNGLTSTDNANVVVDPTTVAGTVSSDQTICLGSTPASISLSGNTGSVVNWQSASDSAFTTAVDILTTATTLTSAMMGTLTATTYFRAIVQSGNCSSAYTNFVSIVVSPLSVAGSISGAATVCSGTNSTTLTLSGYTGTIQWQSSSDNSSFSPISGETAATYTATNLTATIYYRAVVTSGVCSSATSTGTITVLALPTTATNGSTQTITVFQTATLSGNSASSGTGSWSVVSGPSTLSTQFSNTASPTAVFTPAGGSGSYVVRWTISNSPCTASASDATITVNRVPLTITANNGSKTYGETFTTGSGSILFTISGLQNSDTIENITIASSGAVSTAAVGSYAIVPSAATGGTFTASNYSITYTNGTLTVDTAILTITGATANNKTYDGLTTATLSGTAAYVGLQNSESFSVTGSPSASFATATVGTGKTVTVTGYTAPSSNYTLTQPSLTADITTATLTITADDDTKVYGQTYTVGSGSTAFSSIGLQNSETIGSITIASSGAVNTASVGTYSIVGSVATGGSFTASNYDITYVDGSLEVTPASLTITADDDTKVYGQTYTVGSGSTAFSSVGLQNSETIGSITIASSGAVNTASVGTYSIVGSAATGGSFTASNYDITYVDGTLTVTPATLTITADDDTKVYGQSYTVGSGSTAFSSIGLQNSETIGSISIASSGAVNTASVGTYSIVGSAATGGSFTASNYAITYVDGSLTVTPATLTITADDDTKVYGQSYTVGSGSTAFSSTGLQSSETIGSITIASSGAVNTASVGTYSIVGSAATGGSFAASNYAITYVDGTLTVTPAILTVTADDVTKCYGTTYTLGTSAFTSVGLVLGETIGSVSLVSTGDDSGAVAGNYPIEASSATGGTFTATNYDITYIDGDLNVQSTPTAGSIGTSQSICVNTIPASLTSEEFGNGDGVITYRWEQNTNLSTPSWSTISGEIYATYSPSALTQSTQYRRITISTLNGVSCESDPTPIIQITVIPLPVIGTVSGGNRQVCSGTNSVTLTLVGSVGNILWHYAVTEFGYYRPILGQTSPTLVRSNFTGNSTTYFLAQVTNQCGTSTYPYSNKIAVTVSNPVSGTISGAGTICTGSTKTLILGTHVGTVQWQSSSDNFNTSVNTISGATGNSYSTDPLTTVTYYRVVVTNGSCGSATSASVMVTVDEPVEAGSISQGDIVICSGSPAPLTLSGNSTGTIIWYKSINYNAGTNTGKWTVVTGQTTTSLTSGNLKVATWYKAKVTNGSCIDETPIVQVTVSLKSVVKTISGTGTICNGASKLLTLARGSIGALQWQSSTTSATANDFAPISGANAQTYLASPTATTWYRVVATNGVCSSVTSAAIIVRVDQPASVGTITVTTPTICIGTGTSITLDTAQGKIAWQKATVTNGIPGTFTAVTGNTTTTLATGNLISSTAYRVVVTSGVCASITSNIATVTVIPQAKVTAITGFNTSTTKACVGIPKTLTLSTGYIGTIEWLSSPTLTGTYTVISGETAPTYIYTPLANGVMYFKVRTTSSPCSAQAINTGGVPVYADATICSKEPATIVSDEFEVIAYPNPSSEVFNVEVQSTGKGETTEVQVFDMVGRLIENRQEKSNTIELGRNYASGAYTVIVNQGTKVKTLRLIKK